MIDNPLNVKEGDTLALLNTPVKTLTIPLVDIYRMLPSLQMSIDRYKEGVFGSGLYLDKLNIRPTLMPLYDPHKVDELTRQPLLSHNEYELYPVINGQLGDLVSAHELKTIVKEGSHQVNVCAVYNGHKVDVQGLKEEYFYPTSISIAIEMIRDALHAHIAQLRPWINVAVKTKPQIICSLDEQNRVVDAYIYDKPDVVDMLINSPSRLITVTVSKFGIDINLLCDVRVYLWTKSQEDLIDVYST